LRRLANGRGVPSLGAVGDIGDLPICARRRVADGRGQASVVSVSEPGSERRIANVAAGVNGTDAVKSISGIQLDEDSAFEV
jgi:hypothetical protein